MLVAVLSMGFIFTPMQFFFKSTVSFLRLLVSKIRGAGGPGAVTTSCSPLRREMSFVPCCPEVLNGEGDYSPPVSLWFTCKVCLTACMALQGAGELHTAASECDLGGR